MKQKHIGFILNLGIMSQIILVILGYYKIPLILLIINMWKNDIGAK